MPDFVYTRLDCFRYTEIGIRVKDKLLSVFLNVILSKELFQYLFFKKKKKNHYYFIGKVFWEKQNVIPDVFDTQSTLTQCYTNNSST